jgi:SNF2 family DNA or RNA helicase
MTKENDYLAQRYSLIQKYQEIAASGEGTIKFGKQSRMRDRIRGDGPEYTLRDYQKIGAFCMGTMPRFLLADDCGLGKTLQCITALCYRWNKNEQKGEPYAKAIVATTKSAALQWQEAFYDFATDIKTFVCDGSKKKRVKIFNEWLNEKGPSVLITGYPSIRNDWHVYWTSFTANEEHKKKYMLVFDEASKLKNSDSGQSRACTSLARYAGSCWGLTATPVENRLMEVWGVLAAIHGGSTNHPLGSYKKCETQYCIIAQVYNRQMRRYFPKNEGVKEGAVEEIKERIKHIYLARTAVMVSDELPGLIRIKLPIKMEGKQRKLYEDALQGNLVLPGAVMDGDDFDEWEDEEEKEMNPMQIMGLCQQIANHPALIDKESTVAEALKQDSAKLNAVIDMLSDGDLADKKTIVYSNYPKMIAIIRAALAKRKVQSVRIVGGDTNEQRAEARISFTEDETIKVIGITKAACQGVNLQAASAIIFYDLPWSAGDYKQLLGRAQRMGSKHDTVIAYHPLVRNSVDVRRNQVLSKKIELLQDFMGDLGIKAFTNESKRDKIQEEIEDALDWDLDDAKLVSQLLSLDMNDEL